ncbi:MAG: alpha/beta hydrolase [Candidatus Pacebacteria bacterium]|nr:alpha/beta hydrolase [Candidatus Paceibacterota bacterium]
MKTAIIVHGWDNKEEFFDLNKASPSNAYWIPWIQKRLGVAGITAQTPEMPESWIPRYEKWQKTFELFPRDEETILIGYSCGGGFLVRWLSEHDIKVGQLILVAPWIDPTKELGQENDFFDFDMDSDLVKKTSQGVTLFYSTDDDDVVLQSVEKIKATIPDIKIREFTDKGHFTTGDGVSEFPELLEEITL